MSPICNIMFVDCNPLVHMIVEENISNNYGAHTIINHSSQYNSLLQNTQIFWKLHRLSGKSNTMTQICNLMIVPYNVPVALWASSLTFKSASSSTPMKTSLRWSHRATYNLLNSQSVTDGLDLGMHEAKRNCSILIVHWHFLTGSHICNNEHQTATCQEAQTSAWRSVSDWSTALSALWELASMEFGGKLAN
jgi:hypothetical protein